MLDVIVRNGIVVDGTGAPGRPGDIGVRDGRITAVGTVDEPARRVIDADGLVVTPGFVDVHTHYDAQVLWDPALSPSPLHGVTTVFAGNCGITLAPVVEGDEDFITRLLARVESIPVEALRAGVDYKWRSYAEYLDTVDTLPLAANIGFLVGHSALRRAVMGPAASSDEATPEAVADMCRLLGESLAAGGFGFSTATPPTQVDGDGRPTPPNFATRDELLALAAVCRDHPGTCMEFIAGSFLSGFTDDDARLLADMSAAADRHLNWNTPLVNRRVPDLHLRQLAVSDLARERGGFVVPTFICQNGPMQQDFLTGYIFRALPGWAAVFELDVLDRIRALADPDTRRLMRETLDNDDSGLAQANRDIWGKLVVNEAADPALAHLNGRQVRSIAAERGVSDFDAFCDIAVEAELRVGFVRYPYDDEDEWAQSTRESLLRDPRVLWQASDAGAHMDMIVGADWPTRAMAELVRERRVFPIEEVVRQFSSVPAQLYGLRDRGVVAEGAHADLVVLDPDDVGAGDLRTAHDLPSGAARLMTVPTGVHHVLVAGSEVASNGEYTGDAGGRVLRSQRDAETMTVQRCIDLYDAAVSGH